MVEEVFEYVVGDVVPDGLEVVTMDFRQCQLVLREPSLTLLVRLVHFPLLILRAASLAMECEPGRHAIWMKKWQFFVFKCIYYLKR